MDDGIVQVYTKQRSFAYELDFVWLFEVFTNVQNLIKVSWAHQGCIYLIKNTVNTVIL